MKNNQFTFKAKVTDLEELEMKLLLLEATKISRSVHIDTYFTTEKGTLKLRENNRNSRLIAYDNKRIKSHKTDEEVMVYNHTFSNALKNILTYQFGIETIIKIHRKLFLFENIHFQLDWVDPLGEFIRVDIQNPEGRLTPPQLATQYDFFWEFFEIHRAQPIDKSYYELASAPKHRNQKKQSHQNHTMVLEEKTEALSF